MPRPRLLLLLPSTTYRAQAFVEAARRLDIDLTVASDHVSTLAEENPSGLLSLDLAHPSRAAVQALAFHAEHPVSAVFAVDDDTVVAGAAIASALGLAYISPRAAIASRDKHVQRELLSGAGVRVPLYALHTLDEDAAAVARFVKFPCVIKPLRLSASRGVMRANDPPSFVAAVERLGRILTEPATAAACAETARQYLVESFVPGAEVALEGLMVEGRLLTLALFDKPDPLDGPFFEETIYVTPSRLAGDVQRSVEDLTQRAAAALGLFSGPVHAELRCNQRGPWLIEMAARPIGGRCSAVLRLGEGESAITLEELLLRQALGMPIPAHERERAAAAVMMIPIPRAGRLRDIGGLEQARRVAGVDDVVITTHRGQALVPLPEGASYLGFIYARGGTPERAEAAVREAHSRLTFEVEP